MTDKEVYRLLFPDHRPEIDGVQYRAWFWTGGSIGHLVPLDSDGRAHGTVRNWYHDGSFGGDETYVHGELVRNKIPPI